MKNKWLKIVAEVAITLILLSIYLVMAVGVISVSVNLIYTISLLLSGIVLTLILALLIHELGHLITGLILGLKIRSFTFLFFKIQFINKRCKFSFVMPKEFASTEFIPNDAEKYYKKIMIAVVFGLVFSFIALIFNILIIYFGNFVLYCLFGITYPLSAYILLVNLIPFNDTNDGALCFISLAGGKNKRILKNSITANAYIVSGTEPKDLDSRLLAEFNDKIDSYSINVIYLRYLAYFNNDLDRGFNELTKICNRDVLSEEYYIAVFKELFYIALMRKDEGYIKKNCEEVVNYLSYENSPVDYRIHAQYRLYTNEKDWAKLLVELGEKNLENFAEKGICKSELSFLQKIKNQL